MQNSAPQLQQLFQAADAAMRSGRPADAVAAYRQILQIAPRQGQALNALGNLHLRLNEPTQAVDCFRTLTEIERHPVPLFNLGVALRRSGDQRAALDAVEQSLALNPYFSQALFEKASILADVGAKPAAVTWYRNFLDCAAHDPARPQLGKMIEKAEAVVAENRAALENYLTPKLEPLLKDLDRAGRGRMDECVDILLGKAKRMVPEPNFLYVPRLPAYAFYDRDLFPWFEELEAATGDIRAELVSLIDFDGAEAGFKPYIQRPAGVPEGEFAALNNSRDWSVFMFWEHGRRIDENCDRCPKTAAVLDRLPLCETPGRTPTANFSLLKPRTRIPAHSGETNARLIVHLPLIVPEGCAFRVGNETRPWIEGEAFAFDDSMNHEAWNDSDRLRAILMLDTWNPLLPESERHVIAGLVAAMDAFAAT